MHNLMRTAMIALVALLAGLAGGYGFAQTTPSETANVSESSAAMPAMNHSMTSMSVDLGEADSEYDQRFIDAMIAHHEGAIEMAEDAQDKSERPALLQLADEIIAAQEAEIAQMQDWREEWYPTANPTP